MNERVINWLDIGTLHDIPIQGSRRITLNSITVAVFRTTNDEVFAIEDKCPHAGGPLSEGIVHGNCVTCPLHNWVISLHDGTAQGADEGNVKRFDIKLKGGRLMLSIRQKRETSNAPAKKDLVDA